MEKENLEVGDVLYASVGYCSRTYNARYIISRVTKTLAISQKGRKFKRKISGNGYVSFHGSNKPSGTYHARLETDDVKLKYEENKLRSWMMSIDISSISIEKILKIKEIVDGAQ